MYGLSEGTYDLTASPTITDAADSPLTVYYQITNLVHAPTGDYQEYADVRGSETVEIVRADFILPAALTVLEESVFEGVTGLTAVDASRCAEIGKDAFRGSGLTLIRLPKDCEIDGQAFSGCGTVVVFAQPGGTTEAYCNANDQLIFVAEEPDAENSPYGD